MTINPIRFGAASTQKSVSAAARHEQPGRQNNPIENISQENLALLALFLDKTVESDILDRLPKGKHPDYFKTSSEEEKSRILGSYLSTKRAVGRSNAIQKFLQELNQSESTDA